MICYTVTLLVSFTTVSLMMVRRTDGWMDGRMDGLLSLTKESDWMFFLPVCIYISCVDAPFSSRIHCVCVCSL